jgi:hypothetical protein
MRFLVGLIMKRPKLFSNLGFPDTILKNKEKPIDCVGFVEPIRSSELYSFKN